MSKINKLNDRQLKKAGHLVIKEPVYVNGEGVTIPAGRLKVGSKVIFRSIMFKNPHK